MYLTRRRGFGLLLALCVITPRPALADPYEALTLMRVPGKTMAKEFALPGPRGSTVRLADFKGKVIFLNFWATWCPPCREEMPAMERLYQRYRQQGFVVVAVSVDSEGEKVVTPFFREYSLTFLTAYDAKMRVAQLYQVRGLPSTYLINRAGEIAAVAIGPRPWDGREAYGLIESLLKPST